MKFRAQGSMGWMPGDAQPLGRPDPRDWPMSASFGWVVAGLTAMASVLFGDWFGRMPAAIAVTLAIIAAFVAGVRVAEYRVEKRRGWILTARDILFLAAWRRSPYFEPEHAREAARELNALIEEMRGGGAR